MFWGIVLEAGKQYTQVLERSFHVSMAAVGFEKPSADPVSVVVDVNKSHYVLCTLQAGKIPQQVLDLNFTEGEEVSFSMEGEGEVYLTGYILPSPQEYEMYSSSEEESDDDDADEDYQQTVEQIKSDVEKSKKTTKKKEESPEQLSYQGLLSGTIEQSSDEDSDWDPKQLDNKSRQKSTKKTVTTKKGVAIKINTDNISENTADSVEESKKGNDAKTVGDIVISIEKTASPVNKKTKNIVKEKNVKNKKSGKTLESVQKEWLHDNVESDDKVKNDDGETENQGKEATVEEVEEVCPKKKRKKKAVAHRAKEHDDKDVVEEDINNNLSSSVVEVDSEKSDVLREDTDDEESSKKSERKKRKKVKVEENKDMSAGEGNTAAARNKRKRKTKK